MKLLYTLTSYPPAVGGAQLHTHQVVRRLGERDDVQVINHWSEQRTDWLLGTTLLAPRAPEPYCLDGVPVQPITLTARERLELAPFVTGYYAMKPLAIERISSLLLRKLEERAGEPELIHNARIGREGLSYASWKLARKRDIPFVFVPYHHPRWEGWNYRAYLELYRRADGVIALTPSEKRKLISLGVREERIFVTGIGPVVAEEGDAVRARRAHDLGAGPIVLFLGQKYRYKGVEALLEAAPEVWARHPEARFVFAGPRTSFSRRLFGRTTDPRLIELGAMGLQEKSDLLAACALLCVPSSQESFGGVYTEGWAMGRPVIGGDIPAIRDVISDGEDGYVVPQEGGAIAERISYLLAHPACADEMGARGRSKVEAHYSWERLAARTRGVYEAVLHHG